MRSEGEVTKSVPRIAAWIVLWLMICYSSLVRAHQSSMVYGRIVQQGRQVEVTLQVSHADLYEAIGLAQDRPATRAEAEASAGRITEYLAARVTVQNQGHACPATTLVHRIQDKSAGFFFVATILYRCARSLEEAQLTYGLFFDVDPRHQGLVQVVSPSSHEETEHVFRTSDRTLRLGAPLSVLDHAGDYLALGIEHIFTGYDHLAFLFALLLVVAGLAVPSPHAPTPTSPQGAARAGLGQVLRVVTAFTIAHSLTLLLAALQIVQLPSRWVESFIAASIAYIALENLLLRRSRPRHRVLVTFAFGLVHGFGFASVLRELGLPQKGLMLSLLSFNVGVELGQLVVVALVFPILHLLAVHGPTKGAPARLPYRPVELALCAVLMLLTTLLFLHAGLPRIQVYLLTLGVPGLLVVLVPRLGYDRMVRKGLSLLLLGLSLLWLFERITERTLLGGALG